MASDRLLTPIWLIFHGSHWRCVSAFVPVKSIVKSQRKISPIESKSLSLSLSLSHSHSLSLSLILVFFLREKCSPLYHLGQLSPFWGVTYIKRAVAKKTLDKSRRFGAAASWAELAPFPTKYISSCFLWRSVEGRLNLSYYSYFGWFQDSVCLKRTCLLKSTIFKGQSVCSLCWRATRKGSSTVFLSRVFVVSTQWIVRVRMTVHAFRQSPHPKAFVV